MLYDTNRLHLVKRGRTKDVYEVDPTSDSLLFEFRNQASVMGKTVYTQIPRKGEAVEKCAAYWFKLLDSLGINNHFIGGIEPEKNSRKLHQMQVRRYQAFPLDDRNEPVYGWSNINRKNYQLPFEVVTYHHAGGMLFERIQDDKVRPEVLGYPVGHAVAKIVEGERLSKPFVEVVTKFETYNRPVLAAEACRIGGITREEYDEMVQIALRIDKEIEKHVRPRGLFHFSGRKDFAIGAHGQRRKVAVIDTLGTPDDDVFANRWAYENRGVLIELGEEMVRKYYKRTGYIEKLQAIRAENKYRRQNNVELLQEPAPPSLPYDMVPRISDSYLEVMGKITGESI